MAAYIEINDVLNLSLLNTSGNIINIKYLIILPQYLIINNIVAHKVMKQYISYNVWFKIDGSMNHT